MESHQLFGPVSEKGNGINPCMAVAELFDAAGAGSAAEDLHYPFMP